MSYYSGGFLVGALERLEELKGFRAMRAVRAVSCSCPNTLCNCRAITVEDCEVYWETKNKADAAPPAESTPRNRHERRRAEALARRANREPSRAL